MKIGIAHPGSRADALREDGPPAFQLYQNRIKTLSETAIGVVRRAKSRFPRLLERLRKRETEWTVWKGTSRAQGRCVRIGPAKRPSIRLPLASLNLQHASERV